MDIKGGLTLAVQRHVDDFDVAVGREDLGDVSFGDIFGEFLNHNLARLQHQQSASSSSSSSSCSPQANKLESNSPKHAPSSSETLGLDFSCNCGP